MQSALLEAMQERQVTLGDATTPLPDPFLVFATQNPIEQEGTYPAARGAGRPLPAEGEGRLPDEGRGAADPRPHGRDDGGRRLRVGPPVLAPEAIRGLRGLVREIYMDERLRDYIVALVAATRDPQGRPRRPRAPHLLRRLAPRDPRASRRGPRPRLPRGRGYVVPEDVKEIAKDVLRHRVLLTYEAEAENVTSDTVVERILERVEVP